MSFFQRINFAKVAHLSILLATIAMFLQLLLFVYDRWYEPNVADFRSLTIHPVTEPINPGDLVRYRVTLIKFLPIPATVVRKLMPVGVPGVTRIIDIYPDIRGTEYTGELVYERFFVVPVWTPPGEYYLRCYFTYKISPYREKVYIMDSSNSIIIKSRR